jgi:hypothetical protein
MARLKILTLAAAAAVCVGCSETTGPTQPGEASLSGTWRGVSHFGGSGGFTTSMTLTQSGTNVTGTMSLTGGFRDNPINGTTSGGRFEWTVLDGCEKWSGIAPVVSGSTELSGTILQDVTNCQPARSGASGTMNLDKS